MVSAMAMMRARMMQKFLFMIDTFMMMKSLCKYCIGLRLIHLLGVVCDIHHVVAELCQNVLIEIWRK